MKDIERENMEKLVRVLETTAAKIRALEAEAKKVLFSEDDKEAYTQKLTNKAFLLTELPEMGEPFLSKMERETAREIGAALNDFARRAAQAMEISSIFYMSALLYPDDYKEGDRNDLERFIDRLKEKFLE
ncbi:hypothetical protein [Desulforhabdus amnigena]|uniref:Uncharacterized protein n=1 Tax=Desulforhabdus amnigena TaxID=40218 RepID=A0A9W6D517_9BACT|nr:hypothetical protein [Desulforhabdus amnigena]NLJ29251.1 hypothetical protein [Deltaproteobacteria bacterium]GLI34270.1 hypothetical protein DAMNIGENAA_17030 [Desulforhabdus amnigena]